MQQRISLDMTQPCRCAHCGGVYDLGKVTITARYADCSMWNAPCCGRLVDDRGETGWKSMKDYHRIKRDDLEREIKGHMIRYRSGVQ